MNKILGAIAICLALMSCSQSKKLSSASSTLFQKWDLVAVNGQEISGPFTKPVNIEFDENQLRVAGSAACNRFFGPLKKTGESISLGPLASTKMYCDETSNKMETTFLQALEKVNAYKIKDNQLLLLRDKEVLATFVQSKAIPDDLAGKWSLTYITGRRIAFEGLYPDRKPFLVFQQGSDQFTGNTGCNSITGTYNGKKGEKLFNPGASTLMACPGEGEQTFMGEFKNVDRYAVSGDTLTLYSNNIASMKFVRDNG